MTDSTTPDGRITPLGAGRQTRAGLVLIQGGGAPVSEAAAEAPEFLPEHHRHTDTHLNAADRENTLLNTFSPWEEHAARRSPREANATSRPELITSLDGTCGCGLTARQAGRRQVMADEAGLMWLVDTDQPADHIQLPDFTRNPTQWPDAGSGPRLWDALVLALAHQDHTPNEAFERVRNWTRLFGAMSSRHDTGTLRALPPDESVLAVTSTPSPHTCGLEDLRVAAAAHSAHGDAWQTLCDRHLTEALEQVEGVTAASARTVTAAVHGPSPRPNTTSQPGLPGTELPTVTISVVGPGAAMFLASASETRPLVVPGAFTLGDRGLATRRARLFCPPDEPPGTVRFTDARATVLDRADGVVVLADPGSPDTWRPVLEEVRCSGRPFVVALTQPEPVELQDDDAMTGVLWQANPRLAASAHQILQFLVHHMRTPTSPVTTGPAVPPRAPASARAAPSLGDDLKIPARAAPP